jgi:hypothetical protein
MTEPNETDKLKNSDFDQEPKLYHVVGDPNDREIVLTKKFGELPEDADRYEI